MILCKRAQKYFVLYKGLINKWGVVFKYKKGANFGQTTFKTFNKMLFTL